MRLTAQFNGRCATCGKPTPKGSEIEYVNKKAYCGSACVPEETSGLSDVEQVRLADRLGFREFSWEFLFSLQSEAPDGPSGNDSTSRKRKPVFSVPKEEN